MTSALNSGRAFLYQHQHSNNSGKVVRRDYARTCIPKTCRSSSEQCGTGATLLTKYLRVSKFRGRHCSDGRRRGARRKPGS